MADPTPLNYANDRPRQPRILTGFVVGLAIAVIANLAPYAASYHGFCMDCHELIGFPLTFRSEGGYVYGYHFSTNALVSDIVIGIGFSIVFGIAWRIVGLIRIR